MSVDQLGPVAGSGDRLVAEAELGGLPRPVDREVVLADLLESLCRVGEPSGDLPVAEVRADDRVDIAVEDGEPLGVPVEGEPSV